MANSRFDNVRYYSDGSFNIPRQIKVYDGSGWVDLGTKDSYNTKKLCARNDNNFFCATYYRHDVNIPKTINIGSGKYLNLRKPNGSLLSVDNYHAGYEVDMTVEVYDSTPLYTVYTRNQGDIVNQSYNNYVAQVSGNAVRLMVSSNFSGNRISDKNYVSSTRTDYTEFVWTRGEKVRILINRSANSGKVRIRVFNTAGAQLCDNSFYENTQWVGTPNVHRLGSETVNKGGSQSVYGNAKMYYFSIYHPNYGQKFIANFEGQGNGTSVIWSSGSMGGYTEASGTSVYGENYTEYIKQTI